MLSHSRGTPLSHPHCPVGQLRSNARLRLQLRRAFCGSELHGTATVQNAVALCSSFAPDAAAAARVSCGLDARDGLLQRAIAACIRIARPRRQACAGDERAQPAIAGCTRSATEKRQRTLRVAPDLCDLQGPSPRGKTALFTPLFAECLSATTGYWNTMKMVQSPCIS